MKLKKIDGPICDNESEFMNIIKKRGGTNQGQDNLESLFKTWRSV